MEINGELATLTPEERDLTDTGNPVHVSQIDILGILASLDEREHEINARRAADDDELTHDERASIVPDALKLQRDRRLANEMAAQLLSLPADVRLYGSDIADKLR